jgi:hypothetical protein
MDVRSALASSAIQTLRPSSAFVDTVNDEGRRSCRLCSLNLRPSPSCSGLQDSRGPSAACWRVLSLQVRSGGSSSQYAPVGPSSARWNDRQNDTPVAPRDMRAAPPGALSTQSPTISNDGWLGLPAQPVARASNRSRSRSGM